MRMVACQVGIFLWGIVGMLWGLGWACTQGDIFFPAQTEGIKQQGEDFLKASLQLCQTTDGRWNSELASCFCPSQRVFYVDHGCAPAVYSDNVKKLRGGYRKLSPQALKKTLGLFLQYHDIFSILLDGSSLKDSELNWMAEYLDEDPAYLIQGITLPPLEGRHKTVLILARDQDSHRDFIENEQALDIGNIVYIDPLYAFSDASPAQGFAEQCMRVLGGSPVERSELDSLCNTAAFSLAYITHSPNPTHISARSVSKGFRSLDHQCASECSFTMRFDAMPHAVFYSVVLADYVPLRRMLRVGSEHAHELIVFLTPSGQIDAIVFKARNMAPEDSNAVLNRQRWLMDLHWTIQDKRIENLGDIKTFHEGLLGGKVGASVVTDVPDRSNLDTPVKAVIIDTGIDPRTPGLRDRLAISPNTDLFHFMQNSTPFVPMSKNEIFNLLAIFDERGHGTQVASILAANLSHIQIYFIRGDSIGFVKHTVLYDQWLAFLKSIQPDVVRSHSINT